VLPNPIDATPAGHRYGVGTNPSEAVMIDSPPALIFISLQQMQGLFTEAGDGPSAKPECDDTTEKCLGIFIEGKSGGIKS
jgi:hypothetical protein